MRLLHRREEVNFIHLFYIKSHRDWRGSIFSISNNVEPVMRFFVASGSLFKFILDPVCDHVVYGFDSKLALFKGCFLPAFFLSPSAAISLLRWHLNHTLPTKKTFCWEMWINISIFNVNNIETWYFERYFRMEWLEKALIGVHVNNWYMCFWIQDWGLFKC